MHTQQQLKPIGIFDSGIGGLSIAHCISTHLPNEQLLYVADSKYAPYGDLSLEDITSRVNIIADWFLAQGCKAIVVACNTATVNAIDQLRQRIKHIPIIGVEPAIKPAVKLSQNKRIGILVTQATSHNQRFIDLVEQHKNGSTVFIQPCHGLVNLIEQSKKDSTECYQLLQSYLQPLIEKQVDTLVLGCTHYPFVIDSIKKITANQVTITETAKPVTEQLERQLVNFNLKMQTNHNTKHRFYSSLLCEKQNQFLSSLMQDKLQFSHFSL